MNDPNALFGEKPLSTFYGALAGDQMVRRAVEEAFGSKARGVLDGMQSGDVPSDHEDELHDILIDLLGEKGEPAATFVGRGDFDEFPIMVMRLGPVFWVTAMEFDDIGFFGDLPTAGEAAEANYEPFISAAAEYSNEG